MWLAILMLPAIAFGQLLFGDLVCTTNLGVMYCANNLVTNSTAVVWDSTNSRLGIGTTSPGVPLHVVKSATLGTPALSGNTLFVVQNTASLADAAITVLSGSGANSRIYFGNETTEAGAGILHYNSFANQMFLSLASGFTVSLTQVGVGINDSIPAGKLTVGGHAQFSGTAPTLGSCGTGSPSINADSTDVTGRITTGTSTSTCAITFASTWTNNPICLAVNETGTATFRVTSISTTAVTWTLSASSSGINFGYHCFGYES